jgi:ATP-dependent exoDNAse (exonuclease V) alpha subunit
MLRPYATFETIHSSQGAEQDSVILDFVLAGAGAGHRSRMLREQGNPYLANLLNVALSRAKHRLVIFADLTVLERELGHGVFRAIIQRALAVGHHVRLADHFRLMAAIRGALLGQSY